MKQEMGILVLVLMLAVGATACSTDSQNSGANGSLDYAADNGGITLSDGFQAVVVADEIVQEAGEAREITVNENGDIYVALRRTEGGPGIAALRDEDGNGTADRIEYFSDYAGTGIALYEEFLYFSTDSSIVRFPMDGVDLVPTAEPEMVVSGFPIQSGHASKPFTFDDQGHLYVNVGAPSNACQEESRTPGSPGQEPCPDLEWQGSIWQFDAGATGQTLQDDGYRYATGVRNTFPEWHPTFGQLYATQHGRDQLSTLWPDRFTNEQSAELPAEELMKVDDGSNFGWPFCYYDHMQETRVLGPEYGGDGNEIGRCTEFDTPAVAFPGHWAPNGVHFYTGDQFPERYHNSGFIAFHGSWNRAPLPQQGYKVVFVPFNGEEPSGEFETFADGFTGTDELMAPSNAAYRPMGLTEGPDGSLYISDTQQGKIWRIVYTGQ